MNLVLSAEQADELREVLQVSLRELSHEIAATEHPAFRARLVERRKLLTEVEETLGRQMLVPAVFDDGGDALVRELARPGD